MSKGQGAAAALRGVLIPTGQVSLLLPNAAMNEVIDYRDATPLATAAPAWVLGTVMWRQRPMPVVSIERMLGEAFDPRPAVEGVVTGERGEFPSDFRRQVSVHQRLPRPLRKPPPRPALQLCQLRPRRAAA